MRKLGGKQSTQESKIKQVNRSRQVKQVYKKAMWEIVTCGIYSTGDLSLATGKQVKTDPNEAAGGLM